MATRFRAMPAGTIRTVELDMLTLLYHRASGTTHVVGAPVPQILDALADEPLTLADIMARLTRDFDLVDGNAASLAARIDELVGAGLVEAVPDNPAGRS